MLFNSFPFLVLMVVTVLLYYARPLRSYQVGILILASFVFYAWEKPTLLALLILSAGANSVISYAIGRQINPSKRRWMAALGIVINLGILGFFKYTPLLAQTLGDELTNLSGFGEFLITIPLPIGISFYTFQGISLLIDILRRPDTPEFQEAFDQDASFWTHTKRTFLFISFFPQLVAGPIVKAHHFYPQITPKAFSQIDWSLVVRCLILGYFLKVVVADNLHEYTTLIRYPNFQYLSSLNLISLLFGFSMQIFADFAGYSLIAIGAAALFGYRLPDNFNFPYIAQSVSEFWRRWHISLSSWLREYLYYSLGGNRKGAARTYINLMLVMFLGGLWHGAAWSYAVWGTWHGVALALERPILNSWYFQSKAILLQAFRIAVVFVFVTLSWLLFQLPAFDQAVAYIVSIGQNLQIAPNLALILIVGIFSVPVIAYHAIHLWEVNYGKLFRRLEAPLYGAFVLMILFNPGSQSAFIYFQF